MADIAAIGGLVGIVQIAEGFTKAVSRLRNLHDAPKQVEDFEIKSAVFSGNLFVFHEVTEQHTHHMGSKAKDRLQHVHGLIMQSKRALSGMEKLLEKLESLRKDGRGNTWKRLWEKALWVFQENSVKRLEADLNFASLSMGTYTTLLTLVVKEKALNSCSSIKERERLEKQISSLKQQLKTAAQVTKSYRRRIEQLEQATSQSQEELRKSILIKKSAKGFERSLRRKLNKDNLRSVTTAGPSASFSSEISNRLHSRARKEHNEQPQGRPLSPEHSTSLQQDETEIVTLGSPILTEGEDSFLDTPNEIDQQSSLVSGISNATQPQYPEEPLSQGSRILPTQYGPRIQDRGDGTGIKESIGHWPDSVLRAGEPEYESGSEMGHSSNTISPYEGTAAGPDHTRPTERNNQLRKYQKESNTAATLQKINDSRKNSSTSRVTKNLSRNKNNEGVSRNQECLPAERTTFRDSSATRDPESHNSRESPFHDATALFSKARDGQDNYEHSVRHSSVSRNQETSSRIHNKMTSVEISDITKAGDILNDPEDSSPNYSRRRSVSQAGERKRRKDEGIVFGSPVVDDMAERRKKRSRLP